MKVVIIANKEYENKINTILDKNSIKYSNSSESKNIFNFPYSEITALIGVVSTIIKVALEIYSKIKKDEVTKIVIVHQKTENIIVITKEKTKTEIETEIKSLNINE